MSELITRTARLVPYAKRPKQTASFVTAYSYEPLPDEPGAELGSLYVVMEVLVSGRASEEVADLIIETIGEQYYNHPHASTDPLPRFESAIKATNQELSEHVNRGNAAWIGKLSAILAIQVGHDLHVAQTGSAEAFLYRGRSSTHISTSAPARPITPAKTFGSIASGELEVGDRLLLATPALIHQVPLTKLQTVISASSPNVAISEITHLLHGASTERIASLVIEITTPELAALQVRSEEPNEIQLGTPETPLEAAKLVASPIAETTVASSRRVATAAHSGWKQIRPHLRNIGLAAAAGIRRLLSTKGGRRLALVGLLVCISALGFVTWYQHSIAMSAKTIESYEVAVQSFNSAQSLLDTGDKPGAKHGFETSRQQLHRLNAHAKQIDRQLAQGKAPASPARSFNAFSQLINDRIDQIDGLVKTETTTVASLTAKNAHASHFELVGNNAYIIDDNNHSLTTVNVVTNQYRLSKADLSKAGRVINTTISSNNDGMYLLTDKPSVWFYRFDNDSLIEQTVAFGEWPKGASAVATYGSNLYLLANNVVYKHVKNATGWSPKSTYLTISKQEQPSGLAVDGYVYVVSGTNLTRYLAATQDATTPGPSNLKQLTNLRSVNDGGLILATSSAGRLAVWRVKSSGLSFDRQIAFTNLENITDVTYQVKTSTGYAITGNRLVRFNLKL